MTTSITRASLAALAASGLVLTGCAGGTTTDSASTSAAAGESVTVSNCGEQVTFPKATHMLVNDSNIISIALSAGAKDDIKDVSSLKGSAILKSVYGADTIDSLHEISEEYPSLEQIIAAAPDVFVAGYGYGLNEGKGITPEALKEKGIATYQLTEACRQAGSDARGTTDPWEAVTEDITNIGAITGHEKEADKAVTQLTERLAAVESAPKPEKAPVGFVFDTGSDTVFTSGKFGAPNAILEAAGATNATNDVDDTWTKVSWEKIAQTQPDFFVFVDYPGQTFEEKVAQLKANPVTKDLDAVKNNRFINLPYAMWTSGPLNVDAAEFVRKGLEKQNLVPASDVTIDVTLPKDLPGQEYFVSN